MDSLSKGTKPSHSEDDSLNFEDDYNEQEFIKQAHQHHKIQKLSIMDDFNQLCHKLNQQSDSNSKTQPEQENTLAQYYAKLKLKNQQQSNKIESSKQEPQKNPLTESLNVKNNRPSPMQAHIRSASQNIPKNQTHPSQMPKHERTPSQGEAFKKKIIQEMEINDSKRNYSSVEEKKKLLQPSRNSHNLQQNLTMKDYYGDERNIISKKELNKKMMSRELKTPKDSLQATMSLPPKETPNNLGNNHKVNKENNLKESNLLNTTKRNDTLETQKASKVTEKNFDKCQRPKIVLYKQKIDLSLDPEVIKAMYQYEVMKSDYQISNLSMSSIDEGLFGNAIEKQRNTKTTQNVQSPSVKFLQPTGKENNYNQKQFASSPINIGHSPNPTNMQKSIFQRREVYR